MKKQERLFIVVRNKKTPYRTHKTLRQAFSEASRLMLKEGGIFIVAEIKEVVIPIDEDKAPSK